MPRKRELTWQAGSNGRGGRWRKKYKGQSFYFPGGNGKTDQAAYDRAVELWKQKKEEIDAEVAKPHEADYRTAIIEWNAVLVNGGQKTWRWAVEKRSAVPGS